MHGQGNPEFIGGRYQLHEHLGAGGMGVVYRAIDRLTDQAVALKQVLISGTATNEEDDLRLALSQEFRTLASLRHPHIIDVLDYGFDVQRLPYFTMTLLDKPQTIAQAAQNKPLTDQIALLIATLQALAYLHRRGVIHRDLKPGNVLVDSEGVVKVLDFGLSLATTRSVSNIHDVAAGTIAYMAPELFLEEQATIASDLYAIGIIACEMLKGQHPFNFNSIGLLLNNILMGEPDLSGIDDSIVAVVRQLLAKKPAERYDSAEVVIAALCKVMGQSLPPESAAVRESFLQASRFVGRVRELGQLKDALTQALNRHGSVWLIAGESGVGKSRLLDELRIRGLVQGALVLRGQGVAEGGLPYQLWRDPMRRLALYSELSDLDAAVLKPLVPDIDKLLGREVAEAPALDGKGSQNRLSLTIADIFHRQTQPIVLLIEDLQWSIESLEPLKHLIRLAGELSLLVVGSYRDDERPELPDELLGAQSMKLARLDENAIAELSTAMLGEGGHNPAVLDFLKRETEGNTFFIVEVMRALAEEAGSLSNVGRMSLPAKVFAGGIQHIVRRRLNRVPEDARDLLKLAAVAGRELDLSILNASDAWLATCANAAVLEIHDNKWRFAHEKLREALLADLPPANRSLLHRQVAEAIEARYTNDEAYAAVLFEHWHEAGDASKEAYWLWKAGRQLIMTSRYLEAQVLAERGLALSGVGDKVRMELFRLQGDAHEGLNDYSAAQADYNSSLRLAEQLNDTVGCANALLGMSWVAHHQSDDKLTVHLAQQALSLYRKINYPYGIARSQNLLGIASAVQRDYTAAQGFFTENLTTQREIGDREGVANSLNNLGTLAIERQDFAAASDYYSQSLAIRQEIGDHPRVASALNNLGFVHIGMADGAGAWHYFRKSLQLARNMGVMYLLHESLIGIARIRFLEGDTVSSVELASLVAHHPATSNPIREFRLKPLRSDLEAILPPIEFDAAEQRGKRLDLDTVVAELLKEE